MKKQLAAIYQFSKNDLSIYLIFLVGFSGLMGVSSEEGFNLTDFGVMLWFTATSIIIVHITVFVILNKYILERRFLSILGWLFLLTLLFSLLDAALQYMTENYKSDYEELTFITFLGFYLLRLIISGTLLSILMVRQNIKSQFLLLKAENAHKSSELKMLKTQIDPHFLFNNLNTLDALVDTDVKKAKTFIHRLANLYQYLLANRNEEIITLKEELKFAKDYCYLIEERFGTRYQFTFAFETEKTIHKLLPPGAVQTVFENVVKHNTGSFKKPIITEVLVTKDTVIIKNNIRVNRNPVQSYGVGLSNLKARYELLSSKNIKVKKERDYQITLPLLDQLNA